MGDIGTLLVVYRGHDLRDLFQCSVLDVDDLETAMVIPYLYSTFWPQGAPADFVPDTESRDRSDACCLLHPIGSHLRLDSERFLSSIVAGPGCPASRLSSLAWSPLRPSLLVGALTPSVAYRTGGVASSDTHRNRRTSDRGSEVQCFSCLLTTLTADGSSRKRY